MLTAEETAIRIIDIYNLAFGGKKHGRYKIAKDSLRTLTGNLRVENMVSDIDKILFEKGYLFIDIGAWFAILELRVLLNYRPAPLSVTYYSKETLSSDDEDDDDNIENLPKEQ